MNFFEKLNDGIRNVETSFVNLISAIAPWLAPLTPAFMTYEHAANTLNFPPWVAIPAALIVVARAGHKSLLSEIAKEREETSRKVSAERTDDAGKFPVNWRQVRKQLSPDDVTWLASARTEEICYRYSVDDRTARNWRKYAQAGK